MKKKKTRVCLDCGVPITRQATYCKSCGYKNMRHCPPGYKLNIKVKNKGWFKKGNVPWNAGLIIETPLACRPKKGEHRSPETEFVKGRISWNKGKKHPKIRGENHHFWKGDNVGYYSLHAWVKRKLGKAMVCSNCGAVKNIDWSNISGKYLRDVNDYQALCRKCHLQYDRENIPGSMSITFKNGSHGERICAV